MWPGAPPQPPPQGCSTAGNRSSSQTNGDGSGRRIRSNSDGNSGSKLRQDKGSDAVVRITISSFRLAGSAGCIGSANRGEEMRGFPSGVGAAKSFEEPMQEKEISHIVAAPLPPPPCDDLPLYPCVPFLLHPHRPLLLWCSSSRVHAYDFLRNLWEAGGPQQLHPELQQLHRLPIAAADCVCLCCGGRSSALRDSSRTNKEHSVLRRLLSGSAVCPHKESVLQRPRPAASPFSSASAETAEGSDVCVSLDAGDVAAATTASRAGVAGAGNRATASAPAAVAIEASGNPSRCVWVTAGEDKYLHFLEVGSYKLLRSRVQRKKLSAAVFFTAPSPVRLPVAAAASAGARDQQQPGTAPVSSPCVASVPWCSLEPQQQQEGSAVQLLVADKFGDVYLLRNFLSAPVEQSLAGDLLCESMRSLPSVHGVRVISAATAAILSPPPAATAETPQLPHALLSGVSAAATTGAAAGAAAATASSLTKPYAGDPSSTALNDVPFVLPVACVRRPSPFAFSPLPSCDAAEAQCGGALTSLPMQQVKSQQAKQQQPQQAERLAQKVNRPPSQEEVEERSQQESEKKGEEGAEERGFQQAVVRVREHRSRKHAWQRERARLWRQQQRLEAVHQEQRRELNTSGAAAASEQFSHQHSEEYIEEEALVADDSADIPLLSHLTTVTKMKVIPGSSRLPLDISSPTAAAKVTKALTQTRVEALAAHTAFNQREEDTATCRGANSAGFSSPTAVVPAKDFRACRGGAAPRARTSEKEEAARLLERLASRCGEVGRANLLLTGDRDEKIRIGLLEQPWSIKNFYLGHSEFIADFVVIDNGQGGVQNSGNDAGCSSGGTEREEKEDEKGEKEKGEKEEVACGNAVIVSGSGTVQQGRESSWSDSVDSKGKAGSSEGKTSREEEDSTLPTHKTNRCVHQSLEEIFGGKLGISSSADGTIHAWKISNGAQVDALELSLRGLFSHHPGGVDWVLSSYEGAVIPAAHISVGSAAPPCGGSPDTKGEAQEKAGWAGGGSSGVETVGNERSVVSRGRLLPASLLFEEDQRLLLVQCLKLRGLLLIPVEQSAPELTADSPLLSSTAAPPLLSRQPFFVPLPAVPAAIMLLYHSIEELFHIRALADAAQALRPMLVPGTKKSSPPAAEISGEEKFSACSTDLKFVGGNLRSSGDEGGKRENYTKEEGHIPFVWWIDELGRLRPPVCVSVFLLQGEKHPELQKQVNAGTMEFTHVWPSSYGKQILPCVEGCSHDVLGTDYGTCAARTNAVYFWKRTRSASCPTKAERLARRLRHKVRQQRQQQEHSSKRVKHAIFLQPPQQRLEVVREHLVSTSAQATKSVTSKD